MSFGDVGDVLELGEDLAELGDVLHFDHEAQLRQAAIDIDLHVGDVHALAVEHVGDVAHQSLAVVGPDANWNGIGAGLRAPIDADETLAVLNTEAEDVRAILPVDGGPTAASNIADDLVARSGIAAAAHRGEQAL